MDKKAFAIRAFLEEFPFVLSIQVGEWCGFPDEWCACHDCSEVGIHHHPKYLSENEIESVKVSKISPEFLEMCPLYNGATGSEVDIADSYRIFLLNKDGVVLTEVVQSLDITHNEAHTDDEDEIGECVGEALLRLDNPDEVMLAISIHTGYEIRNHSSVGGCEVVLYTSPKGFTLKGWIEKKLMIEAEKIKATIAEIDAEAN